MNKMLKKYFLIITFIITTMQYIENVYSTTDFNNDSEYLTITDVYKSEIHNVNVNNNWIAAEATIIPSKDMNNNFSFDLFYSIIKKNKDVDLNLHIMGCKYPLVQQSINILYNENNPYDIVLLDKLINEID